MDFERDYKQEGIGIEFEYTATGTPQQNGHVEWKSATPFNRVCTMLNGGIFSFSLRNSLLAENANTVILLESNLLQGKRSILSFVQKNWRNVHHHTPVLLTQG